MKIVCMLFSKLIKIFMNDWIQKRIITEVLQVLIDNPENEPLLWTAQTCSAI